MSEHSKSPSAITTRPEGNTTVRPSALERGIGRAAGAKLRDFSPDATHAVREMIERKRQGQDGHARDRR